MKKKSKIIGIITLSIIAIFLIIQLSYSFFAASRKGEKENTFASSCFNIELDVENEIQENAAPIKDEDSSRLTPTTFTIKNTCKISAEVGLNLDVLNTTVGDLSHFKVSLGGDAKLNPSLISDLETVESLYDDTLVTKKLTNIYVRGYGEKKIELRSWLADTLSNGEGYDHKLETKLSLSADAVPEELSPAAEKIIADNGGLLKIRNKEDVDLKVTSPKLIYGETIEESNRSLDVLVQTEYLYSKEYTRSKDGTYTLVNPIKGVLSEDKIGMYTCLLTTDSCSNMAKIKEVDINPNKENYSISAVEKSMNSSSTLAGNKTFGKSFHFDQSTQKFVLDDVVTNAKFVEDYIGYYVCSTSATAVPLRQNLRTCNYIHQIKAVQTDPGEGTYYSKETLNTTVSFTSAEDKTVSTTYTFDNETGNYTLTNPVTSVSYSTDHVGYYTCNTDETTCTTLYKINEVTDSNITKADKLVKTTRYHRLKKSDVYSKVTNYSHITLWDSYQKSNEVVGYDKKDTGLYMTEDDLGDTYYFRGSNNYNNLYFAGYYWNIVRINGDGTIRLIYRGKSPSDIGENTRIGLSDFNSSTTSNTGIGYMYGNSQATSYLSTHQNKNNSRIKTYLESWYENNLISYNAYIADTVFCNDRSIYSGTGISSSQTYYNPYYRIQLLNNLTPTLKCTQSNDRFTVDNKEGNQSSTYPIGLITADELAYGGRYYNSKNDYNYLSTGIDYWTMSPSHDNVYAYIYISSSSSFIRSVRPDTESGVRPVINLKGNVNLSGTGTLDDPYIVEGFTNEEAGQ